MTSYIREDEKDRGHKVVLLPVSSGVWGGARGERERVKKEENLTRLAALPGRLGFNFFSIFGFRKDVRVACRS